MLEILLSYFCAPALAGIKPANTLTCQKMLMPDIQYQIEKLSGELNSRDIYIDVLCEYERYILIMVYRKKVLAKHLSKGENRDFLSKFGYRECDDLYEYISFLKTRFSYCRFPHEIGVFLGYPLFDIYSFINHRSDGCLMAGEWRVYHNMDEASAIFERYRVCRNSLAKKVIEGINLADIFIVRQ